MTAEEMKNYRVSDYRRILQKGDISPRELVKIFLERCSQWEPFINAFLHLDAERVLRQAEEMEKFPPADEELPQLFGIPVAVKDNICVSGIPTTCGSHILENYVSPYEATVVQRLRRAGAIIFGKTNLDQFAMGSSTESSVFGATRNPLDLSRVPGGSSGGSAAAVASLEVPLAIGSDTGGSVRQPAAFCGVVGVRPTYGRVSRYGVVSFASSLDQVGPLSRFVSDAALLAQVLSGEDPLDSTCAPYPPFSTSDIPSYEETRKMRLGIPREYFSSGVDRSISEEVASAVEKLAKEGFDVIEISLPHTDFALEAYYLVALAEASSNLARFDGVLYGKRAQGVKTLMEMYHRTRIEGFGNEVKRRIMLGTYALSSGYYDEFYLKGMKVRTLVRQDFEKAYEACDILLTPSSPCFPFKLGEKISDPYQMYLTDILTVPSAMAGLPSLSLNCANRDGLPVGLQVIAGPFREDRMFGLALFLEELLSVEPPIPAVPDVKEGDDE